MGHTENAVDMEKAPPWTSHKQKLERDDWKGLGASWLLPGSSDRKLEGFRSKLAAARNWNKTKQNKKQNKKLKLKLKLEIEIEIEARRRRKASGTY